jgi:hypothetical protein
MLLRLMISIKTIVTKISMYLHPTDSPFFNHEELALFKL